MILAATGPGKKGVSSLGQSPHDEIWIREREGCPLSGCRLLCRERHGMWGSREIPKDITDRRVDVHFYYFLYHKIVYF